MSSIMRRRSGLMGSSLIGVLPSRGGGWTPLDPRNGTPAPSPQSVQPITAATRRARHLACNLSREAGSGRRGKAGEDGRLRSPAAAAHLTCHRRPRLRQPRGQRWPNAFLGLWTVPSCRSDSRISFQFALPWRRRQAARGSDSIGDRRRTSREETSHAYHAVSPRFSGQPCPRPAPRASLAPGRSLADEGPPETTTIRLRRDPAICVAPWYIAEELLRAEGFTDIRYVPARSRPSRRCRARRDRFRPR